MLLLGLSRFSLGCQVIRHLSMRKRKDGFLPQMKTLSPLYKPKNINQDKYMNYLNDPETKIVFVVGPAGTGKTLLACSTAIYQLKTGNINKIIITRPMVTVEEDLGFLPGNIQKKMDPWTRPIFDIFGEYFSQTEINKMVLDNVIEISPLAYMRGRTFKNAFIIADEMQNSSPNQMMMLTTRIGIGSKMVITGDLNQSDKGMNSGLSDFLDKFKLFEPHYYEKMKHHILYEKNKPIYDTKHHNMGIKLVQMTNADIERNPIIMTLLDIYNFKEVPKETVMVEVKPVPPVKPIVEVVKIVEQVKPIEQVKPLVEEIKPPVKKRILKQKSSIINDAALIPWDQYRDI
jgi:phosphate starvation-inducible PhoH-like protein